MEKQYWIGGFYIDLSRNQITQNQQTQTLAPKALAVLTCLAENQGQVVSQDDLLAQVWPNTIVSPNTLQRSIAQLRKALGDDGKGQIFIKTHAKQGYSLECDVHWGGHGQAVLDQATNDQQPVPGPAIKPADHRKIIITALIAVLAVVLTMTLQDRSSHPTADMAFDTLRSLTATDDKELDPSYSPDGQYIVFHRYSGQQCNNKIWAKHIETQQEIPLTAEWGAYSSHDFSPDGSQLVFFATEACVEPVVQKDCYDLVTLDFNQALQEPQQPTVLLQCKQSKAVKPMWLNDNNIAIMQKQAKRWKLINYSVSENNSIDLYSRQSGNLVDYTYSVGKDLMAVSIIDSDNQQHLELIKPDGELVSSHPIQRPSTIAPYRIIRPSFDPLHDRLIFSTGRQLFTLSYQGKVAKINLPFADRMGQPVFHPEGDRLLMIKGPYDSDLVRLSLTGLNESINDPYQSLERTNLGEDYGQFQPGGQLVAFWSQRSGDQQIWITSDNGPRQLTDFPIDSYISGFDWASDGQSLLVNANGQLYVIELNGDQQQLALQHPVEQLFHWNSENNLVLLQLRMDGVTEFVEYNTQTNQLRVISENSIRWAQYTSDGRLIYKDALDQFWQPGPAEPQPIEILHNQGDRAESFVIHHNTLYAINSRDQLWSYDLEAEVYKVLGSVQPNVDYLTDINTDELLLSVRVAAKKEVVELTVSD